MSRAANSARGEAGFTVGGAAILLRPSFAALVAAEEELGPLFALVLLDRWRLAVCGAGRRDACMGHRHRVLAALARQWLERWRIASHRLDDRGSPSGRSAPS